MLIEAPFVHAKDNPDAVSIIDDRGTYTRRQIAGYIAGLARLFDAVTDKSTVGLLLPSSAAFVAGFYGTLAAGKAAVPINFLLGDKELKHIVADSGFDTVLAMPPLAGRLDGMGLNVIDVTQLPKSDPSATDEGFALPDRKPDELATILYTSGTSGLPKGVELTFNSLQRDVEACIEHIQFKERHRFLGIVPLFHSTGLLATMLAPIHLGSQIVYIARFSPVATAKAIKEHAISVMAGVPSMYGAMIRLKEPTPDDFKSMYGAISGGEPLPPSVREGFKKRFNVDLVEGYGLTETCGPIAFNKPEAIRVGSVGQIIPGVEIRIVDESNNALPVGEIGEVWMKGPPIMRGYHNNPAATADVLTLDGFFKSGDLGRIDGDGYLFITGRKKDMIIVAGEKAFPREIEDAIMTCPLIADAAVVGKKDAMRGEVVVAFVIAKPEQTVTADVVREACKAQGLVAWKCPKEVFVVDELPRTPTGKVLKRELVARLS